MRSTTKSKSIKQRRAIPKRGGFLIPLLGKLLGGIFGGGRKTRRGAIRRGAIKAGKCSPIKM